MKKHFIFIAAVAVAMVLGASIPDALAYFTTYVSAKGSKEVVLKERTTIEEPEVEGTTKSIQIKADEDSEPVFVRVQTFVPEGYSVNYEGSGWTEKDGWIYYDTPIDHGKETSVLKATVDGVPDDVKVGDNFNVIVVYEYTPVLYKDADEPWTEQETKEKCEFNGEPNESGMRMVACWNKKVHVNGTSSSEIEPGDNGNTNPSGGEGGTEPGTGNDTGNGDGTETGGGNG